MAISSNRHDGTETDESLLITVKGAVSGTATVTVNGVAATVEAGEFTCQVPISRRTNSLEAVAKTPGGDYADTITVLWDNKSFKRFRFSIDDNIMFLKDLGQHPEDYSSLFDHWYLAFWQRMHQEYGTRSISTSTIRPRASISPTCRRSGGISGRITPIGCI